VDMLEGSRLFKWSVAAVGERVVAWSCWTLLKTEFAPAASRMRSYSTLSFSLLVRRQLHCSESICVSF
jgi:hypothetical protein